MTTKKISECWLKRLNIKQYRIFPNRAQLYSADGYVYIVKPNGDWGKIKSGQYGKIPLSKQEQLILYEIYKEVYMND